MDKKIFEQEKQYLSEVFAEIDKKKAKNKAKIDKNTQEIQNLKSYFSQHFYEIKTDGDELASINLQIENLEQQNAALEKENKRLTKQRKNPYFGRFDFQ